MQVKTQLGYIMDYLEISGKELSSILNTDITTISKWRNNKRKLLVDSANEIAEYILSDQFKMKRAKIYNLISPYLSNAAEASKQQQIEAICAFLTDGEVTGIVKQPNANQECYQAYVKVCKGLEKGWFEAWNSFIASVADNPKGQELYLGDFGDIAWERAECHKHLDFITKQLKKLGEDGAKINIIDMVTDTYKPYDIIHRWLTLYLTDNIEVFYLEDNSDSQNKDSLNVIPEKAALIGMSTNRQYSDNLYLYFEDIQSTLFYTAKMKTIMESAKQLIYKIEVKDTLGMIQLLDEYLKENQTTYMLNPRPTFRNMPVELLREVLESNDVSEELIQHCININRKRHEIRLRCKYRQIYDINAIEQALNQDYIVEYELSQITGKEIKITKQQFLKQLSYILEFIANNMYTLALVSVNEVGFEMNNTSMIVQENSIVVAWNSIEFTNMLYSKELTFIGGYYDYIKLTWDNIPLINKNSDWTKNKLMSYINND